MFTLLKELLDPPKVELKVDENSADAFAVSAVLTDGRPFNFVAELAFDEDSIDPDDPDTLAKEGWDCMFSIDDSMEITGRGAQFEVFSLAKTAIEMLIKAKNPDLISFSASGESRIRLYDALIKRISPKKPEEFYFTAPRGVKVKQYTIHLK